jgi:hypothetical protein
LDFYLFLIDILNFYLDLLILYQKVKKLLIFFKKKIKTCPKPGPKPKLKNGFQNAGYKHNNRQLAVIKITGNHLARQRRLRLLKFNSRLRRLQLAVLPNKTANRNRLYTPTLRSIEAHPPPGWIECLVSIRSLE